MKEQIELLSLIAIGTATEKENAEISLRKLMLKQKEKREEEESKITILDPSTIRMGEEEDDEYDEDNSSDKETTLNTINLNDATIVDSNFLIKNAKIDKKHKITKGESVRLVLARDEAKGFKTWEQVDKVGFIGEDDLEVLTKLFHLGEYISD